jgi:sporulation protein YlmC with PRC-barrel domain
MVIYLMMAEDEDLKEKKLRGSGGYVIARISHDEQKKGNLGGPELFIAGIGRLPTDRILKYYCNKCEKDYHSSPNLKYENPNEQVGEGVILIEKGEYKCSTCNSIISQYRKFNNETSSSPTNSKNNSFSQSKSSSVTKSVNDISDPKSKNNNQAEKSTFSPNTYEENALDSIQSESTDTKSTNITISKGKYFSIQSIIGMPVYDHEAMLVGNVQEIGLRKSLNGTIQITIKIDNRNNTSETNVDNELHDEISWSDISKIGDIVLVNLEQKKTLPSASSSSITSTDKKICYGCKYHNESDAIYCEQCGKKL